jgi:cytochrome c-type biogenesis protein CcmH/NrfG
VKRNTRSGLVLVVAMLVGSSISCKRREEGPPPPLPPGAGAPVPEFGTAQRIAAGEQIVAREPNNAQAWIQLGNDYFDTHQSRKAIEAYGNALKLAPNNPDVLTDQGVMFREVGEYDKAIANFEKANQIDPKHTQSLYNLGVVYGYDKKDAARAIETWNRVIAVAPGSDQAGRARAAIQDLQKLAPPR